MNYDSVDLYGTYETDYGDDPYKMLLKMSSWHTEIRSTISGVRQDMGEVESQVIQNANEIINRVTYEDYTGERVTSLIVQDAYSINLLADQLNLKGLVTVSDLAGTGTTTIHGSNILTGTIQANRLNVAELSAISADLGLVTAGYIRGVVIEGSMFVSVGVDTETSQSQTMTLNSGIMNFSSGSATSTVSTRTARFSNNSQYLSLRAEYLEMRNTGTGASTIYRPNSITSSGSFTISNLQTTAVLG